ncbi:MAG: NAD-dependent epimerase/dehydratase family protein [Pseudochelatococcus sp.]|uniref:NAD-dependent epimerase/dehydratase family protein n=1 Tax=Pseudochelatococcus sp. TaxID=2020869 RepID=UPI003D9075FF
MNTVLLTGAAGFVGRKIHKHLTDSGYDVRLVLRPGSASRLSVAPQPGRIIETPDLFGETAEWWARNCEGVDTVIHAAWYVKHGVYLDAPENAACVSGTFALAKGAAEAGVGHLIGLGTCLEYRLPGTHLHADSPLEPSNFYAACKLATYHMVRAWLASRDTVFSWCRIFYLYGEGEDPRRLAAYLRRRIEASEVARLSAGTQVRDFLDVDAAGRMIASLARTRQPGAINICSGRPITVRAFAEQIADAYGRRDLLEFGAMQPHPSDPSAVVGVCNLVPAMELLESSNESAAEAQN